MKYLFINSVYGVRSTGKIIAEQCRELQKEGHQCLVAYGRECIKDNSVESTRIGTAFDYRVHALASRCFDLNGFCSKHATSEFLERVERYSPDVVWLHNLHGYYINIEILFHWIKERPNLKVYWTLHDCWAFTGHCAYFTMAKCNKWQSECYDCPQLREYPKTYGSDYTRRNFLRKREAFSSVPNLQLITPSKWLADLTRQSFLSEYPVSVIHNTINKDVFKPTRSAFREIHGLEDKFIVLGVAVGWEKTKGLPDILDLRKILPPKYIIVLVGATEAQIRKFPNGVLGILRTKNQTELAGLYSTADVFVNPTHQDNYPTVNLEARACGTPVVTYNVGGSPESTVPENIVNEYDITAFASRIVQICEGKHRLETRV